MLRVSILMALICVHWCSSASVPAETLLVKSDDVADVTMTTTPLIAKIEEVTESNNSEEQRFYHPAEDKKPRVLQEFNRHYLDGSYEYKYILSNGVTRYEISFWKPVGTGRRLLARKGFYSHPLPNHKYLTVFYTADEHGYQQDAAKFTNAVPTLPKHLDVPQLEFPHETRPVTTKTKPTTTHKLKATKKITTRKPKIAASKLNWIY